MILCFTYQSYSLKPLLKPNLSSLPCAISNQKQVNCNHHLTFYKTNIISVYVIAHHKRSFTMILAHICVMQTCKNFVMLCQRQSALQQCWRRNMRNTYFQQNDFSHTGSIGQNPEEGFIIRDSDTLVGSNLKQKNKGLRHVLCHLLSVSCHPSVNTKAPERTASNCYSVNLQTRMARIHLQKLRLNRGHSSELIPSSTSAFCREWQLAKTGHRSYIAIVSFLMQGYCLSQNWQRMTIFLPFGSISTTLMRGPNEADI